MTNKTFQVVDGDISDGHHTFSELYNHRVNLFLALVCALNNSCESFYKPDHYDGWDAVYLKLPTGQVSYHVPNIYRQQLLEIGCEKVPDGADIYDGHTSTDVINRLGEFFH